MLLSNIPKGAIAITKSDTTSLAIVGFYVGGTGDVTVVDSLGNTTAFSALPAGTVIWGYFRLVKSTGTTATNIVGFLP